MSSERAELDETVTWMTRLMHTQPNMVLLAAQFAVLVGYPFMDESTLGRVVISVVQLVVVFSALLTVRRSPALVWFAAAIALPCMVFAVWETMAPETAWVVLVSAALHVPFYGYVSYALIRYIFDDDTVTRDELFATAAAFTVVAWAFAYLYAATQVIWPGSFGEHQPWFQLLFLSFTAMTNTGLSDVVPALDHARSFVVVEEVVGIFYVALVVSRLVALSAGRSRTK